MKKHQIDFIYGQFSSGNKKYNFKDIYNDPVGLTGSETSCISFAKEMANRGYYTTIFIESIDSIPPQYIWNNLHIQRLHYFRVARKPPEIVYAWNEPDQLMFAPEKALRMVNQQLNDFGYVQNRDYDTITDIYTSPSQSHLDYLSQSTPNKAKWRVLDNGFDPEMFYPREKRPYSVIYASSPDRGLHLLLEAWPQIKKEVPKATLDIFYDCTQFLENEITKNPGENIALKEYVNRGKYILYALDKLKNGYDIKHHKGISKNKIAEEMGRAKVLGYPCSSISFCVVGNTLIDTEKGLLRIENMEDKTNINASSLEGKQSQITKWFYSGEHKTIKITTNSGYSITGTQNHPLLVFNKELEFEWKDLQYLTTNDYLCINRGGTQFPQDEVVIDNFTYPKPKRGNMPEVKIVPRTVNEELGAILGYHIAKGSAGRNKGTDRVMFCNKCPEVIADYQNIFTKCFPDTSLYTLWRKSGVLDFSLHWQYVIKFLFHIGLTKDHAHTKKVPWVIFQSPKNVVKAFLAAYFEGDGCNSGDIISACSVSGQLLSEIQILLLKFGIISQIYFYPNIGTKGQYNLHISNSNDYFIFMKEIGFRSNKKNNIKNIRMKQQPKLDIIPYAHNAYNKLKNTRFIFEQNKHHKYFLNDNNKVFRIVSPYLDTKMMGIRNNIQSSQNLQLLSASFAEKLQKISNLPYYFDKIKSIEEQGIQKVYDLTVKDTHCFIGNGILSHNTEGFSATIVEACASGIVPVISRQDSLGQIYGEALKDTIIDTPTRQHMDKFIEMVVKGLTDDKFAKETTERAMEFAKNYTWEKLGDKLEKIIEEGLEMKR